MTDTQVPSQGPSVLGKLAEVFWSCVLLAGVVWSACWWFALLHLLVRTVLYLLAWVTDDPWWDNGRMHSGQPVIASEGTWRSLPIAAGPYVQSLLVWFGYRRRESSLALIKWSLSLGLLWAFGMIGLAVYAEVDLASLGGFSVVAFLVAALTPSFLPAATLWFLSRSR